MSSVSWLAGYLVTWLPASCDLFPPCVNPLQWLRLATATVDGAKASLKNVRAARGAWRAADVARGVLQVLETAAAARMIHLRSHMLPPPQLPVSLAQTPSRCRALASKPCCTC